MVSYQPTPARHIFDLIGRAAFTERDCLIDLGSGLGHVTLTASICSKASCSGIELEPSYVACARKSARSLNLNNVRFMQGDARAADLSDGTLFYLYTPFTGTILQDVLKSLRHEAASREIRICMFGTCMATFLLEEMTRTTRPRLAPWCCSLRASLPLPAMPSEPENFDRGGASALFRLTTFHFFLHRLGVVSPKRISGRFKRVSATP
jgi:hypothetical protein